VTISRQSLLVRCPRTVRQMQEKMARHNKVLIKSRAGKFLSKSKTRWCTRQRKRESSRESSIKSFRDLSRPSWSRPARSGFRSLRSTTTQWPTCSRTELHCNSLNQRACKPSKRCIIEGNQQTRLETLCLIFQRTKNKIKSISQQTKMPLKPTKSTIAFV